MPACENTARHCPMRSSAMLASAMSSSSTGAWPVHSERRWPRIRAVSAMRRRFCTSGLELTWMEACMVARSHVVDGFGQLVEGRVAIHLVLHRIEVHGLLARIAGDDV